MTTTQPEPAPYFIGDPEEDLESVWALLQTWRDHYPEGNASTDAVWDEACGAMARIREALGLPDEVDGT